MTYRVGIIGLGTVGSRFVEQFNLHDAFDLVAAWDPATDTCAAHAAAVDIAPDADAVIARSDLVYIAVPPLFHRSYVERCVSAGVAIFCEKPLGIDVDESRALVQLIEASGLPAGVNFVFSAAPSATGLLDALSEQRLGGLVRADLRLHFSTWPRAWHAKAQWLRLRDQGGWLREVASHFLFLAQRALGSLSIEAASITFPDGPHGELCETDAAIRFTSARGPLTLTGTSGGAGPDIVEFTLRGTERSARILDWYRLQESDGGDWSDTLGRDRAVLGSHAYAAQIGDVAEMMAGGPHRIATFREAFEVQLIVEELLSDH